MSLRIRMLPVIAAGVAVVAVVLPGTAVASSPVTGNDWPYDDSARGQQYTLAAVGDIACEPADAENASTPAALKCGSPSLGGYDAEYATAQQAFGFHPDAVALLGDEQYEVGKLSDFEGSSNRRGVSTSHVRRYSSLPWPLLSRSCSPPRW